MRVFVGCFFMKTLIIGIGNRDRGDDAAGPLAAAYLRSRLAGSAIRVIEASGEATELMEYWTGAETVILIDAICSASKPGMVTRLDLRSAELPEGLLRCSTHSFGVAEAVQLARALGRLPENIILYGIEAIQFQHGSAPSLEVEAGACNAAELVIQAIQA